ncbi:G2/mitotic-specific cyclin S13-6, variant 2 [Ancistrocladus abbreviatus]
MASRVGQQEQPRGGIVQKDGQKERRNRKALGDIGNLVTIQAVEGKPQQINRPVTRSFGAQLLANAQAVAEKNKKQGEQVADLGLVANVKKPGAARKVTAVAHIKKGEKQKPDATIIGSQGLSGHGKVVKEDGSKKKKKTGPTLSSVLTARSKEACGITRKLDELILNIDEGDQDNNLAVAEYVEDIYSFYKLTEDEGRVQDYMGMQPDINERMRSILVDWLIEVHHKFELRPETLYLTINIIDRFLSLITVPRKELQLVGISSMLIASKYEEIWAPQVNDFVCISDRAYVSEQMENMVFFFAELGLLHYSTIISYSSSTIAASSVYAARCTLEKSPTWTGTLRHYTGYSEEELKDCAKLLVGLHSMAPESKLKAVYKKFSKPDFGAVALRSPAKSLLA